MKKILFFLTTFLFILISAECAHSQTEGYSNGNVRIVQESDSWQVLHGTNVIAHGDGILSLDASNLPPDAKSNPLENTLATTEKSIPQIIVGSTGAMTDEGYYIREEWSSVEFTATKKYLTQVDVLFYISGDPGKISIAIANYDDYNIIWGRMFFQSRINNKYWTSIGLDEIIEVMPGQKYYLSFKANTYNPVENTYYAVFEDSDKEPMYRIWGSDTPIVTTQSSNH